MADEVDALLARVDDPALRLDLRAHIDRIRAKRTFGLVFESHLPERVRLPEHPIRPGSQVVLRDDPASLTYQVLWVRKGTATVRRTRHPDGARLSPEEATAAADQEIVVEGDGTLRVLDLFEPHVRTAVRDFDGAQVTALYDSDAATPFL